MSGNSMAGKRRQKRALGGRLPRKAQEDGRRAILRRVRYNKPLSLFGFVLTLGLNGSDIKHGMSNKL